MKFNGITKKGREYLAKIQSLNKPINFSKIKIGDGLLDNYDNPSELIDLQNFKIEKGILELNQENETVILKTNIDNVNLQTGYYPREIGVFVNDDGQELMYYYMNDGDETSWIPPESDGPFRIDLKINLIATNTTSIVVPNSGKELYITKEFIENNYTKNGSFTGTAKDLEDRIIGLAGKQNGKFPLNSAIKGNVYLLEQTQKFYVCTQNYSGTTISVPNANFTELSVYENMNRLENLTRKTKVLLYNGGSLVPNNTVSSRVEETWDYLTFGVGTNPSGDRMAFLVRRNFSLNGTKIKYQGIELEYNANSKTLRVINNGGNLYFIEQHSSLT